MFRDLFKRKSNNGLKDPIGDDGRAVSAMVRQQKAMIKKKQQQLDMLMAYEQTEMMDDQIERQMDRFRDDEEEQPINQEIPSMEAVLMDKFLPLLMKAQPNASGQPETSSLPFPPELIQRIDWEKLIKFAEKAKILK